MQQSFRHNSQLLLALHYRQVYELKSTLQAVSSWVQTFSQPGLNLWTWGVHLYDMIPRDTISCPSVAIHLRSQEAPQLYLSGAKALGAFHLGPLRPFHLGHFMLDEGIPHYPVQILTFGLFKNHLFWLTCKSEGYTNRFSFRFIKLFILFLKQELLPSPPGVSTV